MNCIKKSLSLLGTFFCIIVLMLVVLMQCFPKVANELFPYRMYTILTGSMEPILPVNSLVIVKDLNGREPKPEEIITFRATRQNQTIILTHYFAKTDVVDGTSYYRTHPYGIQDYDLYETTYQDIQGAYVTHIPYVGRFVLYLGSPFGFAMILLTLFITLLYHYCDEHFNLDEEIELPHRRYQRKHKEDEFLTIRNIRIIEEQDNLIIYGELWNETNIRVHRVKGKIVFRNEHNEIISSKTCYLLGFRALKIQQCHEWNVKMKSQDEMEFVQVEILRAKKRIHFK